MAKVVNNFFYKKITNSQTFLLMPLYTIYECLILKNKDNARKNFIILATTGAHSKSGRKN